MLGRVNAQGGSYQQLSIFTEVLNRVQSDYVDEPSMKLAFDGAIRGMIESVDVYGGFLGPKEVEFYKTFNPAKTTGIGAVLSKRFGYPVIVSVIPGGAADKAGLRTGDMLESIDGATTREMNLVQVHALLSTPAGKAAKLSVVGRRRNEPQLLEVSRSAVPSPAVEAKMLEGNIGYLRIPVLFAGKAQEARQQLDGLMKKGASKIVLDLRGVASGEEREAVDVANLFLDQGSIGYLQGQKVDKRMFPVDPKLAICKLPLAVLVNQGTAGPAEIVAGAISDNARGQLVGLRTFGIGSSQKLIPVEDGHALLLSVAKYYTPNGKEIQEGGLKPSIEVAEVEEEAIDPGDEEEVATTPRPAQPQDGVDRQLKKAIEVLNSGDAKKAA